MRKLTLLISMLVLFTSVVFAQGKKISGTVVDSNNDNEPVIGATVQVKGNESVGTITDFDGNFTITLPDGATTLVVSYMGMQTTEVVAKNGMVVKMAADAEMLEEVIAIGYGTSTKKSFAGSATVVSGESIEKKNPSEMTKALAGEVAGVQVVSSSGQPGSSATIRIRGVGSLNASSAPLYVVDGIPYTGDYSSIDPSDIASMTVLKDATATSLYGSRGSNGVILITTKKGTSGETGKIDVDLKYGVNTRLIPMYETISDAQRYVELAWEGLYNQTTSASLASSTLFSTSCIPSAYNRWEMTDGSRDGSLFIDENTGLFRNTVVERQGYVDDVPISWRDAIFRDGQKIDATLKLHGGSGNTTYYSSFGYLKDEGYYIGSDYSRLTTRLNVDHQPKKWLKANMNLAYTYSNLNNPGQSDNMNNGFAYVNQIPPIYTVFMRDDDGYRVLDDKLDGYAYDYGDSTGRLYGQGINPAGALQNDYSNTVAHQVSGSTMLEVALCKGLKFTTNFGMQYYNGITSDLTNSYYGDAAGVGRIYKADQSYLAYTFNQLLNYTKQFNNVHNLDVLLGHEINYTQNSIMYGGKNYIVRTDGLELSNAIEMSYLESYTTYLTLDSYFAQLRYNYDEKYFIHANYRADGSSRFAAGNRWGNFGAIGGAWLVSNEDFLQGNNFLQMLKLKASWGVLGNQEISNFLYTNQYTIYNVDGSIGLLQDYVGNSDLTWESSHITNVGFEAQLGKYLDIEGEYFYKTTQDLLQARYVAPSLGYSYYYVNDGALMNQGVEFAVNTHLVNTNNFKLDVRLNGSWYETIITEMPTDNTGEVMQMNGSMSVGRSPYEYYMPEYAGVNPDNGAALYTFYYDPETIAGDVPDMYNGEYITSVPQYLMDKYADDPTTMADALKNPDKYLSTGETEAYSYASYSYVGKSATPKLYGGFGFDMYAYGFDFSATFQYQLGGYGYDYTYASLMHSDRAGESNWHTDIEDRWQNVGDVTDVPRLSNGSDLYANSYSTRFLISSNYLSLSNVRLGYTFPKKVLDKIKLSTLNLWVSADNLFCLSAREGYIPMASFTGSSDSYQYTPLSTIMGGVKFSF
ncbi:MAG: SusC/RagA family TonB-linked outer membrane protein [bacterium]